MFKPWVNRVQLVQPHRGSRGGGRVRPGDVGTHDACCVFRIGKYPSVDRASLHHDADDGNGFGGWRVVADGAGSSSGRAHDPALPHAGKLRRPLYSLVRAVGSRGGGAKRLKLKSTIFPILKTGKGWLISVY